jgi:TetR/AcrR family fatty acid metabolism transcriptional regulator
MKRSSIKKERKRQKILTSAIRVFAKKGFYNTRIKEIAKLASVADGTIYLYFKNKDDILISIFDDRMDKLNEKMEEISHGDMTSSDKIRQIIELQLGNLRGHRDLAEVITINLRQSNRFLKQYAAPRFNRYLDIMARIIKEGQDKGEFTSDLPARVLATSLFGALDGLMLTWVLGSRKHQRLMRAGSNVAGMMLNGLLPRDDSGQGRAEQG